MGLDFRQKVDSIRLPSTPPTALDANAKYIITAPWDNSAGRIIRTSDGKEIGQIRRPR